MGKNAAARRAVIGACLALFANMGMNSVFAICLPGFKIEWPEYEIPTFALAITIGCAVTFVSSTFLVGPVLKKLSPRVIFLICALLGVAYCTFYYLANGLGMLLFGAVFGGLVLSFGVHAMGIATITPYFGEFGKKLPAIIGVVLAAASLGAAVFSFLAGKILAVTDWRNLFLAVGAIVIVCNAIAFLLIPQTKKVAPAAEDTEKTAAATPQTTGLSMKQAIKAPSFWLTFFGILFLAIMYFGLCNYMVSFLSGPCGMEIDTASSMQAIMQLVGIVFVLTGGALVNKIGIKGLILFAAVPLAVGCLLYAFVFPSMVTVWFAVVCSVLCVSGCVITNVCSTITPVLFGSKSMNQINSIYSGGAFWGGAALASQVIGTVLTNTGSYPYSFLTGAIIGIVGMVALFLALALNPMKQENKQIGRFLCNKEGNS